MRESLEEPIRLAYTTHEDILTMLVGPDAVWEKLEPVLPCDLFIFDGHGLSDQLLGQSDVTLVDKGRVDKIGRAYMSVAACLSGRELGPEAVRAGALGFLGYDAEVWVVIVNNKLMEGFKEIFLVQHTSFNERFDINYVYERTVKAYRYWIKKYYDMGLIDVASMLVWNLDHLVLITEVAPALPTPA